MDPIPDPYLALGLAKDATAQQIKATYRKLALKYHPDKVTDESLKASAADNFHKIQQAYEVVGDESKRSKYDASIRLAELQKAYQKEKEATDRYRSSQPPPMRADVRTAAYEVPTSTARGGAAYSARGPERYETFRPRNYESDYFDDAPASKSTGRKQSSYADVDPKKYSKSDSEKKKSSRESEKEKSSRHHKSKTSERERRKDRESKKTYIVPDETDTEPEYPSRRYDSARETSREYGRKEKSSESEESADDMRRKVESKLGYAANYIGRSGDKGDDKRRTASLRTPYDRVRMDAPAQEYVRRSSARSPVRESSRREAERPRQYSDPNIYRTDIKADFKTDMFKDGRPPLEKHNTTTADQITMDRDRRYRTVSSAQPSAKEAPGLKRHETDPSAYSNRRPERYDRPELPRGQSSLRYEVNHGIPTPPLSPPKDAYGSKDPYSSKSSRKYIIEEDHTREVSPGTRVPRRTRSPSPLPVPERERKSRTSSSRHARAEVPDAPTVPLKLRTGGFDTIYADRMTDSPRSAKPMSGARDYFATQDPLPYEIPSASSRSRHSPREQLPADTDYIINTMSPKESTKERRSSKSSRPKNPHRSHTHAYGSGFGRGIFA